MAELDQARPQIAALPESPFADGHILGAHLEQPVPRGILAYHALRPAAVGAAFPWPPVLAIAISVERSFARYRDVLLSIRVEEGRVVHALDSLPACVDQRKIALRIAREQERRSVGNVKIHV